MLSFHQSRGRILFETFCAMAVAASFVGAWMDLGTPALLAAAAVFGLFGLVRLFDMRQPAQALAEAATDEHQVQCPPEEAAPIEMPMPELVAEPAPSKPARVRRKKQATADPAVVEFEEPSAGPIVVTGLADPDDPQPEPPAPTGDAEEPDHPPVTPLFEPEPFVRQQRAVFGRKAG